MEFLRKRPAESVDTFLTTYPPSQTSIHVARWLYVQDESRSDTSDPPGSLAAAMDEGQAILDRLSSDLRGLEGEESGKRTQAGKSKTELLANAQDSLLEVARRHGQTMGKWMLFVNRDTVDRVWTLVARETVAGGLGSGSKVSTDASGAAGGQINRYADSFLICVYVAPFYDLQRVRRVFERLCEMNLAPTAFKLDFYTHLGLDSRNQYGLNPSIYTAASIRSSVASTASKAKVMAVEAKVDEI
ncbi:hypothetical protein HK104_000024 [Borealophlyctis nickersoniae]|nr:hypothetical protein HK104_000024 [Borealophlyctis nickersoniae]